MVTSARSFVLIPHVASSIMKPYCPPEVPEAERDVGKHVNKPE